ncbi:MAG: hypothetical protein Q8P03_01615 [bacterium]|nr:hypothetical protein [bacterium]
MSGGRDKTEFVLGFLEDLVSLTGDIMSAFFDSYPSRRGGFARKSSSGSTEIHSREREEAQRFYSLLALMKRQGLIERREKKGAKGRQSVWKITKRGLEKLFAVREKKKFSSARVLYEQKNDSVVRVVVFDVPERERYKRVWLRTALLALGFSFCQQSVWVGKRKIPERFLEDLRDREMLSYIQIFEVTKQGSLERMSF